MALQSQAADRCGLQQDRRRSACFYHQTCPRQLSVQVRDPPSAPVSPGSYASALRGTGREIPFAFFSPPPPYPHRRGHHLAGMHLDARGYMSTSTACC
ncbi:hypothetical protein CGRA01v4_14717 [Colletotrichum graminicola]|nr:hypothetical protein CGRA01v4_14717 [Colletotrichum graminicola]